MGGCQKNGLWTENVAFTPGWDTLPSLAGRFPAERLRRARFPHQAPRDKQVPQENSHTVFGLVLCLRFMVTYHK